MDAAQYLRKSRMEEGMETEEVLAKHRKALADFAGRYRPSKQDGTVKNSLAGLVRCANCGKNMQKLNMNGGP